MVSQSGIQLTTTTVSIAGESTKVLGLSDVSKFLYPFALEGFEGVNPTITITADYPEPEDGNFVLALDAVEAKKVGLPTNPKSHRAASGLGVLNISNCFYNNNSSHNK